MRGDRLLCQLHAKPRSPPPSPGLDERPRSPDSRRGLKAGLIGVLIWCLLGGRTVGGRALRAAWRLHWRARPSSRRALGRLREGRASPACGSFPRGRLPWGASVGPPAAPSRRRAAGAGAASAAGASRARGAAFATHRPTTPTPTSATTTATTAMPMIASSLPAADLVEHRVFAHPLARRHSSPALPRRPAPLRSENFLRSSTVTRAVVLSSDPRAASGRLRRAGIGLGGL